MAWRNLFAPCHRLHSTPHAHYSHFTNNGLEDALAAFYLCANAFTQHRHLI